MQFQIAFDVERYLPAHLPMRNKYHLHEVEDLGSTKETQSQSIVADIKDLAASKLD